MTLKTILAFEELKEGEQLEALVKEAITKVQLVKYAGASGDFNPLHTDDAFAKKIGMDGVIAHGMLVMGFLGQYLQELASEQAEITTFKMRFGAMTRPGDQITCFAVVEKLYTENEKKCVALKLIAEKAPQDIVGSGKAVLSFRANR